MKDYTRSMIKGEARVECKFYCLVVKCEVLENTREGVIVNIQA